MAKDLSAQREQAAFYQALTRQQRAYYLQSERLLAHGKAAGHRAGEIALVTQPKSLEDCEIFDVGTAVAWPLQGLLKAFKGL